MKMVGWQAATWQTLSSIITVTCVRVCVCVSMCVVTTLSVHRHQQAEPVKAKPSFTSVKWIWCYVAHTSTGASAIEMWGSIGRVPTQRGFLQHGRSSSQRIKTKRESGVLFNDAELLCYDYVTSVVRFKHSEKILTQCHSVNHKSHMDGSGIDDNVTPVTRSVRQYCLNCTLSI